jgi:hypothetical protein
MTFSTATQLQLLPGNFPFEVLRTFGSYSSLSDLLRLSETCRCWFANRNLMILDYAQTEQQRIGLTPPFPFTFNNVSFRQDTVFSVWNGLDQNQLRAVRTNLMNRPLVLFVKLNQTLKEKLTTLIIGTVCSLNHTHKKAALFKDPYNKTKDLCKQCYEGKYNYRPTKKACSIDSTHSTRMWVSDPDDETIDLCQECSNRILNNKREAEEPSLDGPNFKRIKLEKQPPEKPKKS